MPRDGSITPADLVGKLEWLDVRCEKAADTAATTLPVWLSDSTRS
jgi:hypothetical protein